MADIVYISTTNQNGAAVMSALNQIASGIYALQKLDGLRANSIGTSAATLAANFGVSTDAQAQALSDRIDAFLQAYESNPPQWLSTSDPYVLLRDLLEAATWAQ
jgi:hypothetical protein